MTSYLKIKIHTHGTFRHSQAIRNTLCIYANASVTRHREKNHSPPLSAQRAVMYRRRKFLLQRALREGCAGEKLGQIITPKAKLYSEWRACLRARLGAASICYFNYSSSDKMYHLRCDSARMMSDPSHPAAAHRCPFSASHFALFDCGGIIVQIITDPSASASSRETCVFSWRSNLRGRDLKGWEIECAVCGRVLECFERLLWN